MPARVSLVMAPVKPGRDITAAPMTASARSGEFRLESTLTVCRSEALRTGPRSRGLAQRQHRQVLLFQVCRERFHERSAVDNQLSPRFAPRQNLSDRRIHSTQGIFGFRVKPEATANNTDTCFVRCGNGMLLNTRRRSLSFVATCCLKITIDFFKPWGRTADRRERIRPLPWFSK
jgi:hypothetical protein